MEKPTTRKLRSACDRCHAAKIRCLGGKEACAKCEKDNVRCHFSYRTHVGKPKGSLNKRTIERLKGVLEASATDSVEARYAQSLLDCSRNGSSSQERTLSQSTASTMTERSSAPTTPPSPNEQLEVPDEPLVEGLDASLNVADSLSESELERAMAAGDDETFRFTTPIWQDLERSPGSTMNQANEVRENARAETGGEVDHLEAFVSLLRSGSSSQRTRQPSSRSMLGFVEQPHVAAVPSPAATAAADRFFPTPAPSYILSTPGRSNTYEQHHPQPCNCTQELANCVSEVRATDKTDISVRLDANLYGYDRPLASVTSALRCVTCSADAQILLLATMIMTTVVRWVSALTQPAVATAPFRVQYGEFGEFFASEDASDIVRIVLTGQAFANLKETIGLLQQRAAGLNDESPETKLLRCQVDGLMASFTASKAQFKLQ